MSFSSEQLQRARELLGERRKHGAIQRLLMDEFNLRPAQCRALIMASASAEEGCLISSRPFSRPQASNPMQQSRN